MKKFLIKTLKVSLYFIFSAFLVLFALFTLYEFGFLSNFSSTKFDKNKLSLTSSSITIVDSDGSSIPQDYTMSKVELKDIPQKTIDAFTSIEDKNFYKHSGLNFKRIAKAMINNLASGRIKEGASTISQQVIKNTHLSSERTIKRKMNEILLTKEMEKNLTKDEILTSYLNAIYFGSGAFGLNSASQRFYSKSPKELNLNESATLAGIIKSPKLFSPIYCKENCIKRRNLVLQEMLRDGKISKEECEENISKDLELNLDNNCLDSNNYYRAVINEACELLHITEKDLLLGKYKISTYLDPTLQAICDDSIKNVNNITNSDNIDGAILVVDNKNGGIKAFCGKSMYNLLDVKRQPGSIIKPIISYGPALEYNIIYPSTKILDEKTTFEDYSPHNYKNVYHGYVSAKESLAKSYNIPSIKLLQSVGIDRAKNFASKMSFKFNTQDQGLSLAVGAMTDGVTLRTVANAYQAIASNGQMISSRFIKQIQAQNGNVIYKNTESSKQVMKDSTAFLLSDMLRESVTSGTCKMLNLKGKYICGKTGTVASANNKNENSDVWSLSFSKDNTVCCWMGATGKEQISKSITGSSGACNLAKKIYERYDLAPNKITPPNSVEMLGISEMEYSTNNRIMLCSSDTPDRYKIKAYFAKDNEPKLQSNMFDEIHDTTLYAERSGDNSVILQFDAKKHLKYTLYRTEEDETKLIKEISNKNEIISIEDNELKLDTFYTYFLKIEYLNSSIMTKNIQEESNRIKMYLSSKR